MVMQQVYSKMKSVSIREEKDQRDMRIYNMSIIGFVLVRNSNGNDPMANRIKGETGTDLFNRLNNPIIRRAWILSLSPLLQY